MINISKNVIKLAFTVRCCSSNKCETLSISIFSRLGIECKSTSKFVCCQMKERKGEKWVLQNVVSIKANCLFLIKSCGLHLKYLRVFLKIAEHVEKAEGTRCLPSLHFSSVPRSSHFKHCLR